MPQTDIIIMSKREIDRYEVIKRLIRKELNGTTAAKLLKLSVRQTKRMKVKIKQKGAKGIIHGNRGKESPLRIPGQERKNIVSLIKEKYYDFGPTFAAEKLEENHGIKRDPKTVRQIMIENHLWAPKAKKQELHRAWRQRRTNFGEMEQFDGSYHHWFEDRAPKCCLLISLDDATGTITAGKFAQNEGVFPVFDFWLSYLKKNGKPVSIYMDKFSTYKMSQKAAIDNHDLKTQFQRALTELQIEPIFANSPQAKGRVEKLFETLQDRLVKELRLKGISEIETANRYLVKIFIPKFNRRFGVEPRGTENFHRGLTAKELKELESVFSKQADRTVQNDFTVSYGNHWYQLTDKQPATVCKRDKVTVELRLDNTIKMRLRGKYLNFVQIEKTYTRNKLKSPWVIPATVSQTI
jgi:hypothetical protein